MFKILNSIIIGFTTNFLTCVYDVIVCFLALIFVLFLLEINRGQFYWREQIRQRFLLRGILLNRGTKTISFWPTTDCMASCDHMFGSRQALFLQSLFREHRAFIGDTFRSPSNCVPSFSRMWNIQWRTCSWFWANTFFWDRLPQLIQACVPIFSINMTSPCPAYLAVVFELRSIWLASFRNDKLFGVS